jgi:hypothetical protein
MEEALLTKMQAYRAMYHFLEHLYEITNDDSLGGFLGSMQLGRDGMPFDQAYWEDWEKAVEKTLHGK